MKLTSRSEYALLALVYLARNESEEYISAEAIALAQKIPLKFLEQILFALKRAKRICAVPKASTAVII
ncbi:MAG TPA: Rrf2 family transcriptional regulator [Anaerolineae bacterium]|nr:Rrf2 family transcriptional regulator [Anaerolineae bacterium]